MENIPKPVHLWEVDGFVKLSDKARDKFKRLIRNYGVRGLAKQLKFDRETLYSIYGRKKFIHSIYHLIKIAKTIDYDLKKLEKEVVAYGIKQANMYNFKFPFILNPLHLRATTIHGDGSYDKVNGQTEYYQDVKNICYFERLLKIIFNKVKARKKDGSVFSITIPSILVKLVCKSLDLKLKDFQSEKFFYKVAQLPTEYKFQVFSQFIVDECHFKGNTFTVSQKKRNIREGFIYLLRSLNFTFSKPKNNKDDVTIYAKNFSKILKYLNKAIFEHGETAGFWFKEENFRRICEECDPLHYKKLINGAKINTRIFKNIKGNKKIFSYRDIKKFRRTHSQAQKAIRCWKKNKLIKRIGWNKYEILK